MPQTARCKDSGLGFLDQALALSHSICTRTAVAFPKKVLDVAETGVQDLSRLSQNLPSKDLAKRGRPQWPGTPQGWASLALAPGGKASLGRKLSEEHYTGEAGLAFRGFGFRGVTRL